MKYGLVVFLILFFVGCTSTKTTHPAVLKEEHNRTQPNTKPKTISKIEKKSPQDIPHKKTAPKKEPRVKSLKNQPKKTKPQKPTTAKASNSTQKSASQNIFIAQKDNFKICSPVAPKKQPKKEPNTPPKKVEKASTQQTSNPPKPSQKAVQKTAKPNTTKPVLVLAPRTPVSKESPSSTKQIAHEDVPIKKSFLDTLSNTTLNAYHFVYITTPTLTAHAKQLIQTIDKKFTALKQPEELTNITASIHDTVVVVMRIQNKHALAKLPKLRVKKLFVLAFYDANKLESSTIDGTFNALNKSVLFIDENIGNKSFKKFLEVFLSSVNVHDTLNSYCDDTHECIIDALGNKFLLF